MSEKHPTGKGAGKGNRDIGSSKWMSPRFKVLSQWTVVRCPSSVVCCGLDVGCCGLWVVDCILGVGCCFRNRDIAAHSHHKD